MGLGCILDQFQPVSVANFAQRRHLRRLPIQVHRNDGFGTGRNGRFGPGRVQVEGLPPRFHQHRHRARIGNRQRRGNVGVRGHNDLIALADSIGFQDQKQCIQPVAAAHAVVCPAIRRKGFFKGAVFRACDVKTAAIHPLKCGAKFRVQFMFHRQK